MPYTPKEWTTGEVITADDLNLITPLVEPLVSDESENTTTYHTAEFIYNAAISGRMIALYEYIAEYNYCRFEPICACSISEGAYTLKTFVEDVMTGNPTVKSYTADSGSAHFSPSGSPK